MKNDFSQIRSNPYFSYSRGRYFVNTMKLNVALSATQDDYICISTVNTGIFATSLREVCVDGGFFCKFACVSTLRLMRSQRKRRRISVWFAVHPWWDAATIKTPSIFRWIKTLKLIPSSTINYIHHRLISGPATKMARVFAAKKSGILLINPASKVNLSVQRHVLRRPFSITIFFFNFKLRDSIFYVQSLRYQFTDLHEK